ncbi:beta-ketoacyl-ACP synthase II [Vibrio sonorensis]|uniref:beta-ketoacyl-ACP synthase II n=1 Tax=Vibrio sonorensis TaxID=1004316 RepID=UPI0008DA7D9B|nr:beta-ketoacyl-ACP synthase II [Vibrio sonorensis]
MRRVVVTGMGVVSSIGNDLAAVTQSLKLGRSGIRYQEEYERAGLRCHIAGSIEGLDLKEKIPRKQLRFMGEAAAYSYVAAQEAIQNAGLTPEDMQNLKTGLVMGSGGASTEDIVVANTLLKEKGIRKVGPYRVTSTMGSTVSACLSTALGIKGMNVSMSSACSTSAHCIGYGAELIQWGKQDRVIVGGGEAEHVTQSCLFDAMGAFSTQYNETPERASRPYDEHRDGFVIAGGGGVLILEEYEMAKARNATIIAELVGFGTASDGYDMVAPSGEGATNAMKLAIQEAQRPIDYVNTHGTSTPAGDIVELEAMDTVFAEQGYPIFSSTKSLTGHSLGAAGVHEAIYSLIMLSQGFVTASANIDNADPKVGSRPLVTSRIDRTLKTVMSNSFGFGGTNVSLVFSKID